MSTVSHEIPYIINEQSFTSIFNEYWERMYAICYHNTKDIESSKEMVQDIFRSLWEKRNELQIKQSIEHYLLRAAKLKACEYIRNQINKEQHKVPASDVYFSGFHFTEEDILYKELTGYVELLVDTLSFQCRKVYQMSQYQGMSNKEIASALLISEKTVSYHLMKAKETLQQKLVAIYHDRSAS